MPQMNLNLTETEDKIVRIKSAEWNCSKHDAILRIIKEHKKEENQK